MSLSRRQRRLLDQRAAALRHTDPALAGKLAVFTRLADGQPMPGHERLRSAAGLIRAVLAAVTAGAARNGSTTARPPGAAAFLSPARRPPGPVASRHPAGRPTPATHPSPMPPDPPPGGGSPLPPGARRGGSGMGRPRRIRW